MSGIRVEVWKREMGQKQEMRINHSIRLRHCVSNLHFLNAKPRGLLAALKSASQDSAAAINDIDCMRTIKTNKR